MRRPVDTHSFVEPPNATRLASTDRTTVSAVWSDTIFTNMNRENFSRAAKNCTRDRPVFLKQTWHSPKSNWAYSPGSPSKRTSGSFVGFGRSLFTRALSWLRPPV